MGTNTKIEWYDCITVLMLVVWCLCVLELFIIQIGRAEFYELEIDRLRASIARLEKKC
jgi:hypothetical protein